MGKSICSSWWLNVLAEQPADFLINNLSIYFMNQRNPILVKKQLGHGGTENRKNLFLRASVAKRGSYSGTVS
ncbi:hypothetical protein [Endozoicomonas sp. YOMI1]|uniref:hypothetical protein n=1 Tax=Endozoicomonas sp. YOMI1 TaxID=2828739 RepID=UPI00214994C8|nr:hypothetical protein [Endozoicomonas sp. YOMI1]